MIHLGTLRDMSRELIDPSYRGHMGELHTHHGLVTTDDYPQALAIVRELAEHTVDIPSAGWRWWVELLTWRDHRDDPVIMPDNLPQLLTFTIVARDASVPAASLTAARLRPDEAARVALVVTAARDRTYRQLLDVTTAHARLMATMMHGARPEIVPPGAVEAADETLAVCERASGPLTPMPTLTRGGILAPTALASDDPRILEALAYNPIPPRPYQCPRCQHIWIPRVDNPRKCPRCQVFLRWPTEDTA